MQAVSFNRIIVIVTFRVVGLALQCKSNVNDDQKACCRQLNQTMINHDLTWLSPFREDGRKADELRNTEILLGINPTYDGSCLYKQGLTQVLCLVNGPYQRSNPNDNLLKIEYTVAPFSSLEKRKSKFDKEFSEFAESVRKSFEGIVTEDTYSKSQIEVIVTVIENEGSAKSCVINCITLGLTNAGISMRDVLVSCTVAHHNGQTLIDTNEEEEYETGNQLIVSYLQRTQKMDYLELQKAKIKQGELREIYKVAVKGCEELYRQIRRSLIEYSHKKMLIF